MTTLEPRPTGRECIPWPQAIAEQQSAAAPEAEVGHHQLEVSDGGGGAPGVPTAGARGEQRRSRRVRPVHHATRVVQRGGRGGGAGPREEPAAGQAARRRRGVAGAAGGAVRQRVQPQARTCPAVRHHPGMLNTEVETGCPWPLHTIPPPSLVVASYRACLQTSPIDIGLSYIF